MLASQKWPVSCDDVDLSDGELDFQVSVHTPTSLLIYRTLVGVMRAGASAVLAAVTVSVTVCCVLELAQYLFIWLCSVLAVACRIFVP